MRNCSPKVSVVLAVLGLAVIASAGTKRQQSQTVETRVETSTIPSAVKYELSRTVASGRIVRAHDGTPGSLRRTYRVTSHNGKVVSKELVKEERTEPTPTLFVMGRAGFSASRGSFARNRVLEMDATAYHSMVTGSGRTRTGERAKYGVVAVDPRVIPMNSLVFVEGYGLALACDTGSAIRGNRIDLCFESRGRVNQFGHQRVRVHVLR